MFSADPQLFELKFSLLEISYKASVTMPVTLADRTYISSPRQLVEIKLFGKFSLRVGKQELQTCPGPAQQLLAILILDNREVSRSRLAREIWPECDRDRGLFYVRRALTQLRDALGPESQRIVSENGGALRFETNGCSCDWSEFSKLLAQGDDQSLRSAIALQDRPFLSELRSEWAESQRRVAHEHLVNALLTLAQRAESREDLDEAAATLQDLVAKDPLQEEAWKRLMKVLGRQGKFSELARTYRDIQRRLKKEIGLPPSKEISDLYRDLLSKAHLVVSEPQSPTSASHPVPHVPSVPQSELDMIAFGVKKLAHDKETCLLALRLLNRLFPQWHAENRLSEALGLLESTIDSVQLPPCEELVESLFRAAEASHTLFRLEKASQLFRRAEAMADLIGLQAWSAESLRARGDLAANLGRLEEAQGLLAEAHAKYASANDLRGQAHCIRMLGYVAREAGDRERALHYTKEALGIHTALGDQDGRLWCVGSLGALYLETGEDHLAEVMFLEALAHHNRRENLRGQVWNLTMLGELYLRSDKLESAKDHLEQALNLHERISDGLARAWPLTVLGNVHLRLNASQEATDAFEESLILSQKAGWAKLQAMNLLGLCEVSLSQNNPDEARKLYDQALQIENSADLSAVQERLDELAVRLNS